MRILVLLTLSFLFSTPCTSQEFSYGLYKKYNLDQASICIILPDSVIDDSFDHYTDLVDTYWKGKGITFITKEEANQAIVQKEKLILAEFETIQYEMIETKERYGQSIHRFVMRYLGEIIMIIYLDDYIDDTDWAYVLNQTQFIFNNKERIKGYYMYKESTKVFGDRLPKKMLLLTKKDIGALTETELKKAYPYKFEIVSEEEKAERILEEAEGYVTIYFGNYLYSTGTTTAYSILYDLSDGAIISYSLEPKRLSNEQVSNHILSTKILKGFVTMAK
jgi:hypothetical protein